MSGITGAVGPTDYGMMSSLVANAASVKQKLDQLYQPGEHRTGRQYLCRPGQRRAGVARPATADRQHADLAEQRGCFDRPHVGRTNGTDGSIQSIASNFYAQLNNVQGVNSSEIDSVASERA